MTDEKGETQRILGKLEAGIENLTEQQKAFRLEQRADNKLLFARLDDISANGCTIGKQHSEAIKDLQNRPGRLVAICAAIISSLAALGAWLKH